MIQRRTLTAAVAVLALLASACGGAAAPAAKATAAPTVAPTVAAAPARAAVPATGNAAKSAKLGEAKLTLAESAPGLAAGNYLQTVSLVTLEKGGWTLAHKHGGIEAIYVLDGTIDFRTQGGGQLMLKAGQGASVRPGTVLQAINGGDGVAKFIAFFLTAEGAPFQTASEQAP